MGSFVAVAYADGKEFVRFWLHGLAFSIRRDDVIRVESLDVPAPSGTTVVRVEILSSTRTYRMVAAPDPKEFTPLTEPFMFRATDVPVVKPSLRYSNEESRYLKAFGIDPHNDRHS